ncbi:MAG: hypothetical protein ABSB15_25485 [Bryobacteraceae bacterium]|jgi:hypothetical protein
MFNRIRVSTLAATLGVALLAAAAVPQLSAGEFDNKTIVSFGSAVEISGQVLPAATYVFRTLSDNRDLVQVVNLEENHVYGMFSAIPIENSTLPGKARFELFESNGSTPEAVHAWFYPGLNYGWEFPASKTRNQAQTERAD